MTPKDSFIKVLIRASMNIDCDEIATAMMATGWGWGLPPAVPDVYEVRQSLANLVNHLIDNFDNMQLKDEQTLARQWSGGWFYIIEHWAPDEYRVTIIHGHSGEADNIDEYPYEQLAAEYESPRNVTIHMTEHDAALYLRRHELRHTIWEARSLVRAKLKEGTEIRIEELYSLLCEAFSAIEGDY